MITLGTMNFGARTPEPEARKIIDRAIERGITHFDTANVYVNGESERIIGAALKGRRDKVEIATKCGASGQGLAPKDVLARVDESLARLQTDYVDLFYLHVPDPKTPIEATLEAVSTLLANKKIRRFGVSNYASWQILEMKPRPLVSQVLYNLLVRQLDVEYFRFTQKHPIHSTIYNPLAGGMLAGGKRGDSNAMYRKRYWNESLFALADRFRALAEANGLSIVTMAYAWVAHRPGVDSVLCGPGTLEHLDAAIDACAVTLVPELLPKIDEIHREYLGTDASYAR